MGNQSKNGKNGSNGNNGCLLSGNSFYVQTGELGEGNSGVVVKALDLRLRREVAIKLLPRGDFVKNYRTYVKREIQHHSSLHHPLIVSLKEIFLTPSHLAIVMEYAEGGDLLEYVLCHRPHGRLREQEARWIFQQLVVGLDYCHRKGVANRDLKLENLLLDRDGRDGTRPLLKICDFGYCKHEMNSSAQTRVGTPVYMAPEVILGENRYDPKKSDIWSCGVILYAMLYGKYPFDTKEQHFARKIVTAQFSLPPEVEVSEECKNLVLRMLVADPSRRMGMEDIKEHSWFLQDLIPGVLSMNDLLLNNKASNDKEALEKAQQMIESIVDLAQKPGVNGEILLSYRLLEPLPN